MDLIILSVITTAALVLFVTGRLRVDLVGLLVLSALALTGLVSAKEALAGFSSPAVVTVWAMFILSAGLTRTGIAQHLGRPLQRFTKGSEAMLVIAIMVAASLLSALINTVTVAAILLPTTMELARRSGRSPSRLLMPLALGCLLGGPFTGISTPPNILVTDALRSANLEPFAIFDFTPITGAIVVGGIVFIVLIGRGLLPDRTADAGTDPHMLLGVSYELDTHIFTTRIPNGSPLEGRTLAQSRLGSALFLTVLAIQRKDTLMPAPRSTDTLQAGDTLIVHGRPDHLERFHGTQHLKVESSPFVDELISRYLCTAEGLVGEESPLTGSTLGKSGLRRDHRVHVSSVYGGADGKPKDLRRHVLSPGDRLVIQGERQALEEVERRGFVNQFHFIKNGETGISDDDRSRLMAVRVPAGSVLAERDLVESRLGNAFGLTVVGIAREGELLSMPSPQEKIQPEDLLILQGQPQDLEVLAGLQELRITSRSPSLVAELESQQIGVTEVLLSPRTTLAGKTLSELLFRDHYGVSVLAIWRKGRAYRTGLQDMPLQFGDALLVYGPRRSLEAVARNPDFLVLDAAAAQAPRLEKAPIAGAVMVVTLLSAILGFVPIAIAAVAGSALMVLSKCLSMEEAYSAIEWKVIFLIACMLPLGVAVENTGAAQMAASALIAAVGDWGPRWVVAALFFVTVMGTQVIPTAALVVLMTPVALSTAETLGISPHLLMMTIAISASASFASPLSHPANLLVMGPGGYRFIDYVKVGVPLTFVAFFIAVWLLPILWPA